MAQVHFHLPGSDDFTLWKLSFSTYKKTEAVTVQNYDGSVYATTVHYLLSSNKILMKIKLFTYCDVIASLILVSSFSVWKNKTKKSLMYCFIVSHWIYCSFSHCIHYNSSGKLKKARKKKMLTIKSDRINNSQPGKLQLWQLAGGSLDWASL